MVFFTIYFAALNSLLERMHEGYSGGSSYLKVGYIVFLFGSFFALIVKIFDLELNSFGKGVFIISLIGLGWLLDSKWVKDRDPKIDKLPTWKLLMIVIGYQFIYITFFIIFSII